MVVALSLRDINKRIDETAAILKAIGDPLRLRILGMLADGELCACKFHEAFGLPQNLVSHHLKVLQENRLITGRKHGRNIFYSLNTENIKFALDLLEELAVDRGDKSDNQSIGAGLC